MASGRVSHPVPPTTGLTASGVASVNPEEVDVSTILVEDSDVVRWLLHEAERDPRRMFNDFAPHACKLCDDHVAPREQRAHVAGHRREKQRLAALQRRAASKRLRTLNKLRRESRG